MLKAYNTFCGKYPLLSTSVTFSTLVSVGDTIAQRVVERKETQDFERTARFAGLNFCLIGPAIKLWYTTLERTFTAVSKFTPLKKVAADQLLFAPCINVPVLVCIELMKLKPFNEAVEQMKSKYPDVITGNYKIWPAAQLINFYLVPFMYRTVFACLVSIVWNIYFTWKVEQKA